MIYDRKPFTDWVVEVLDYEEEGEFIGFYRTTFSDGKECEQFTLIYEHDSDELLVQVRIYKNGDIMVGNLVPSNVMELADELNIGLDSFVFVDDNPTERELIRQVLPMVSVPEFPAQPYMLPEFFRQIVENYFKVYSITDEDKKKTEQYKANACRAQAQKSFEDFDKFLESLDMQIGIESLNEFNLQRIAQMTQKTNQFNLTTKRYTDTDVSGFAEQGWKIWCISVADKFGDNGITGCIMVNGSEIDTFLLSCRILGKGIEMAFVKKVFKMLFESGAKKLTAKYIPTAKNGQVKDFWDKCGFTCTCENADGSKDYSLDLAKADLGIKDFYHIEIK